MIRSTCALASATQQHAADTGRTGSRASADHVNELSKVGSGVSVMNTAIDEVLVAELLFGLAQPLPGAGLDDDNLVWVAQEEFGDREFCIVRRWMVFDVMHGELGQGQDCSAVGGSSMLFVHSTVFDTCRDNTAKCYLTHDGRLDGCFFETEDKVFILAGRGARKYVSAQAIDALRAYLCA